MLEEVVAGEPRQRAAFDWLIDSRDRTPLQDSEIHEWVTPALVTVLGGRDGFDALLARLRPFAVESVRDRDNAGKPWLEAILRGESGQRIVRLAVDDTDRVATLFVTEYIDPPASWHQLDEQLTNLGLRVSFAAAELGPDGTVNVEHGVDADTARPTGSTFKLYVLAALARAVADGRADWTESLPIRDEWKSLPSGVLQDRPDGDRLSLSEYADHMMGISDNTATDHLIHRLGRTAVERELISLGNRHAEANIPFLTTKAFFHFRGAPDATATQRYLRSPQRRELLEQLERTPLPRIEKLWPTSQYIDELGWHASAADVCRALSGLEQFGQPAVDHALSHDNEGLGLDPEQFPTVWSKPGRESGVLSLAYLARTASGRTFCVALLLSDLDPARDPFASIDVALSLIRGAFGIMTTGLPSGEAVGGEPGSGSGR